MAQSDEFDKHILKIITDALRSAFSVPPLTTGGTIMPGSIAFSGSTTGRITTSGKVSVNTGITSTGMSGFSEKGEPGEWDMAVGEVYGYRWWKIAVPARFAGYMDKSEHGVEVSPAPLIGANSQPWKPGKNEAVCTAYRTSVPTWDDLLAGRARGIVHEPPEYRTACGCGFWAYFDKDLDVDRVLGGLAGKNPNLMSGTVWLPVFGVVKGTGRVIIGTKGFRSQYAEIIGLCVSDRARQQLSWYIREEKPSRPEYYWNNNIVRAMSGPPGWYTDRGYLSSSRDVIRQASDKERLYRIATVEALLSTAYPDARIFSDQAALVKYFPPDKNYGR